MIPRNSKIPSDRLGMERMGAGNSNKTKKINVKKEWDNKDKEMFHLITVNTEIILHKALMLSLSL